MTSILSFESTDCSASAGIKRSIRGLVPTKTCLKGCQALYISAFTDYLGWGQEETHPRAQRTVNRLYDFFFPLETWGLVRFLFQCRNIPGFTVLCRGTQYLKQLRNLRIQSIRDSEHIGTCISVWNYLSIQWNLKKKNIQFFNWKFKLSILKSREGLHSSALASKVIAPKDIMTEPCCPLSCERLPKACHSFPALNDFHVLRDCCLASKGQKRKT